MKPVIFHVDVNSAFLSWSALQRKEQFPEETDLRDIPSAVGGDVATRHGVITAKSIPAKRYHVTTGEPVVKALQKCPDLVLVRSDFQVYRQFSRALMAILSRYANAVEQVSIDEAYLDMSSPSEDPVPVHSPTSGFYMREAWQQHIPGDPGTPMSGGQSSHQAAFLPSAYGDPSVHKTTGYKTGTGSAAQNDPAASCFPLNLADQIREEVFHTLGFTVNVGISCNRLLAKTASDFVKPGRIHTLWPEEVPDKLWPLPIGELHGCGAKSAARLRDFGILTVGDAAHADPALLQSILGEKGGLYIYQASNGISSSIVAGERDDAKSYSNETTLSRDITFDNYETDAWPVIRRLSESVARRLRRDGVYAGTIEFSVKTDDFRRHSRQRKISPSTNDAAVIEANARRLARELLSQVFAAGWKVRLIGVGASMLDHGEYRQMDLFQYAEEQRREEEQKTQDERRRRLDEMMRTVEKRYGSKALHKGAG